MQTGALFAVGASGEVAKGMLNPGSASTAQTSTGSVLVGIASAAPGIGKVISAAGKISGGGAEVLAGVENTYPGAATGLASSMFTLGIGDTQTSSRISSGSGFK